MNQLTLYGIKNCNTVKKAMSWLDENNISYDFSDSKKAAPPADHLSAWCEKWGWEKTLNRAGMTWRKLSDVEKASITDKASAMALMQAKPSIIKRPIIERDGSPVLIGFKEAEYTSLL